MSVQLNAEMESMFLQQKNVMMGTLYLVMGVQAYARLRLVSIAPEISPRLANQSVEMQSLPVMRVVMMEIPSLEMDARRFVLLKTTTHV